MKTSWFRGLAAAAVAAFTFGFAPSAQAGTVTLTQANIAAAATSSTQYRNVTMTTDDDYAFTGYALIAQHSKATSDKKFCQINTYASKSTYVQIPAMPGPITNITMTVSNTQQPMGGGGNTQSLSFCTKNGGTAIASATGSSKVTINLTGNKLKTGYINASGGVRIWDIKVSYAEPELPTITGVKALQRYPWNGMVDIAYELSDDMPAGYALKVQAADLTTGEIFEARAVSAETAPLTKGAHTLTWDMNADGYAFVSTNVSFTVVAAAEPVTGEWTKDYVVVDLSKTPYAYEELDEVPEGGWTDEHKTTKLVLRRIEPGLFTMGIDTNQYSSSFSGQDDTPHSVMLTSPYYIGVFEVTQKQWEQVMGTRPSYFTNETCYATRPVENVTYDMLRGSGVGAGWPVNGAVDETSFMGVFRRGAGLSDFDLPTEAQWEYACRAGTQTLLNSGKDPASSKEQQDDNLDEVARNYYNCGKDTKPSRDSDTTKGTAAVGSYDVNAWGLYDMHGNVWDWCLDWYDGDYGAAPAVDPRGAKKSDLALRILRGGSWLNKKVSEYTSPCRGGGEVAADNKNCGFRMVRTLQPSVGGASEPTAVDLRTGVVRDATLGEAETLTYSTKYEGGATVDITVNGAAWQTGLTGSGTIEWTPSVPGLNELAHIVKAADGSEITNLVAKFYVATPMVEVTPQPVENATAKVYTNGVEVAGPPFVVVSNATVTVVYTAEDGYAFPDGSRTFDTGAFTADKNPTEVPQGQLPKDPPTAVTITGVTALQRYPWNGLVDIAYELSGDMPAGYALKVWAINGSVTNEAKTVSSEATPLTKGAHTLTWDMNADGFTYVSDDVVFAVGAAKQLDAVQLWENGPYFATCNVGATKPAEFGYYFWWGDTVGYKRNAEGTGWISVKDGTPLEFNEENCGTYDKTVEELFAKGYADANGNLTADCDAARAKCGSPWRMMTAEEVVDFTNNCTWAWVDNWHNTGTNGYEVSGKDGYAANGIFLPAAGYGQDAKFGDPGKYGNYWAATADELNPSNSFGVGFNDERYDLDSGRRFNGMTVRPVCDTASDAAVWGASEPTAVDLRTGVVRDATLGEAETLTFSTDYGAHKAVQLWKDGPCFATCNIGAEKPTGYGYYFWWGDTVGYTMKSGTWSEAEKKYTSVVWQTGTGSVEQAFSPFASGVCATYNKGIATLQSEGWIDAANNLVAEHDAATAHWGPAWRMMTHDEFGALCTKVEDGTVIKEFVAVNGVKGVKLTGTGAFANNSIFIPAAGGGDDTTLDEPGSIGYLLSSTPDAEYSTGAWDFDFALDSFQRASYPRYQGMTVRPVLAGDVTVTITVNGEELVTTNGTGTVEWTPSVPGTNVLEHIVKAGATEITNLVAKFYVPEPREDCLTFSSAESFTLKVTYPQWNGKIYWSTDKITWTEWSGSQISAARAGGTGDYHLYLYGNADNTKISSGSKWALTGGNVACTGNIETLRGATGDEPSPTKMTEKCYKYMFANCPALTNAPALTATNMALECYCQMFYKCGNLKTAPELPATELAEACYSAMFAECKALTVPPELPATKLAVSCYDSMFKTCTALRDVPELPASQLVDGCYWSMFQGCSSLVVNTAAPGREWKVTAAPPTSGNAWGTHMFDDTAGNVTGQPALNTTYYVKSSPEGIKVQDGVYAYKKGEGTYLVNGNETLTNTTALANLGITNLVLDVTGIGDEAFYGWRSIRDVQAAANCATIGVSAFEKCYNVTNMTFAATGKVTVKDYAFLRCNSLETLTFSGDASFGTDAFMLMTGIYMKEGMPKIYPIPQVTVAGYTQKLYGTMKLEGEKTVWTEITTEQQKTEFRFFKIKLVK